MIYSTIKILFIYFCNELILNAFRQGGISNVMGDSGGNANLAITNPPASMS